jgi:hypothetical protein
LNFISLIGNFLAEAEAGVFAREQSLLTRGGVKENPSKWHGCGHIDWVNCFYSANRVAEPLLDIFLAKIVPGSACLMTKILERIFFG